MALSAINYVWSLSLEPTRKLLLMSLADYADELWVSWPSRRTLARRTGVSIKTVDRHLRTLEDEGHIAKIAQKRQDGTQSSNRYRIVRGGGDKMTPPGDKLSPPGDTGDEGGATQVSPPEPPCNPFNNTTTTCSHSEISLMLTENQKRYCALRAAWADSQGKITTSVSNYEAALRRQAAAGKLDTGDLEELEAWAARIEAARERAQKQVVSLAEAQRPRSQEEVAAAREALTSIFNSL